MTRGMVTDHTGFRWHYLTVLQRAARSPTRNGARWEVQCDCGRVVTMRADYIGMSDWKSCGCMQKSLIGDSSRTHGMTKQRPYNIWSSMVYRCTNPNAGHWERYGGRGISVCERWLTSFKNFWADMGPTYQPGLTLDRLDNDGNYEPRNCAWRTRREQSNNRSDNTVLDTPWGRVTVTEAAHKLGLSPTAFKKRLLSWPKERLFAPKEARHDSTTPQSEQRCPHGHEYKIQPSGRRICPTCSIAWTRQYRERQLTQLTIRVS